MSATASSSFPEPPLQRKKRRFSALEFLTISPPKQEDAKRPRILVVEEDTTPAVFNTSRGPTPASDFAGPSSPASDRGSPSAPGQPGAPLHLQEDAPLSADEDDDDDYTSSSSNLSTSSSSSSSSSSDGQDYDNDNDNDAQTDAQDDQPDPLSPALHPDAGPHFSTVPSPFPLNSPDPGSSSLASRLQSFLPALCAANEQLEADRARGRLDRHGMEVPESNSGSDDDDDDDDDDGQEGGARLIEMNLGLGVLEERRPGEEWSSSSSSSSSSSAGSVDGEGLDARERDVVGRLMGRQRQRPEIEVLPDGG